MAPQSQRSEPKAAQSPGGHNGPGPGPDDRAGAKAIPAMAAGAGLKVLHNVAPPALHNELGRLRNDGGILRLAVRYADGDHDLADDALQETCWAILRVKEPQRIDNLEAYFRTVLKRTVADQREHIRRAPVPVDNMETLTGEVDHGTVTPGPEPPRPVDAQAVSNVLAAAWLARLRRERQQLRALLPDSSADPGFYRDVVVARSEEILRSAVAGSVSWADCNEALRAAYPEWFAEPGCKQNTIDRRLCRARDDVRAVLKAVVVPSDLRP
jgi:DNA-directed RNA polymerase specialized sigma24 family protein